jgi:hypothetical protein
LLVHIMASQNRDFNKGTRSIEAIYADIEAFQQLGDIEEWGDRRSEAEQLLQEWLDLPDDTPEDQELAPFDPRAEWLWDQLERLEPINSALPLEKEVAPDPLVFDVDHWLHEVKEILKEGWQQFDRFRFCYDNGPNADGDLAAKASSLWAKYDFLDRHVKHTRLLEITLLWSELERHIDPDGSIHEIREKMQRERRASELKAQGRDQDAAIWMLPKEQWKRPEECSEKDWASIIKPFNRLENPEPLDEFLARVELAQAGRFPSRAVTAVEDLSAYLQDAHTKIREMIDTGAGASEIQELINQQPTGYNQTGLAKFAEQCRVELERQQDLSDALEELLLRGAPPAIHLADYVPADWLPMFRVLRNGLKFSDEAIVMTVMAGVAAMLPPDTRIAGWSLEETPVVWLFLIGSSGTAKSVLLSNLIYQPMAKPRAAVDRWNEREDQRRKAAAESGEDLPPFRKRNLIYTAPTTQGIRADLAEHGEEVPGLLVRDELNGWLKQMADDGGAGVGDVEFWLSSYDGVYSNDVFADAKKSREVRCGKLSVIGGIQPRVFLEQLEAGNANGFNSRPLFVHLPRDKRELTQPDEQTERLTDLLGDLYLAAFEEINRRYVLSREAEALFKRLFDQLEELSLQANSEEVEALWAKGPGQVLRVAAAVHFIRIRTGQEELEERGFMYQVTVVSARSLQLAANLVMAGKTRAVQLHERAANPMLERADRLLEMAKRLQCKAGGKGVSLSALRKGWPYRSRPSLAEIKQMATMLQSRGLVHLMDGGKAIRVVR